MTCRFIQLSLNKPVPSLLKNGRHAQNSSRLLNGFMQPSLRYGCAYKRGRLRVKFRPFPARFGGVKG